jgi:hypothetical protein
MLRYPWARCFQWTGEIPTYPQHDIDLAPKLAPAWTVQMSAKR